MVYNILKKVILGLIIISLVALFLNALYTPSPEKRFWTLSIKQDCYSFILPDVYLFDSLDSCNFSDFYVELPLPNQALLLGDQKKGECKEISIENKNVFGFLVPVIVKDWGVKRRDFPLSCEKGICYYKKDKNSGIINLKLEIDKETLSKIIRNKNPFFKLKDVDFSLIVEFKKEGKESKTLPYYNFDKKDCSENSKKIICNLEIPILKPSLAFPSSMELSFTIFYNYTYNENGKEKIIEKKEEIAKKKYFIVYYAFDIEDWEKVNPEKIMSFLTEDIEGNFIYPCQIEEDKDFTGIISENLRYNYINLSECGTSFNPSSFDGKWFCKKKGDKYLLLSMFAFCKFKRKNQSITFIKDLYFGNQKTEVIKSITRGFYINKADLNSFCKLFCFSMNFYYPSCNSVCNSIFGKEISGLCKVKCDSFCTEDNLKKMKNSRTLTNILNPGLSGEETKKIINFCKEECNERCSAIEDIFKC